MNNIKYLHAIRGFAAFMVAMAHAKWPFWVGGTQFLQNYSFANLTIIQKIGLTQALISSNGTTMVIVFYVLSGFVISYSYQKNGWTYKQFLVNRAIRIYIPYLASAIIAGCILWIAFNLASPVFQNPVKDYHESVAVAREEGLTIVNFFKTLFFAKTERINYFGFNYVYWSLLYEALFYLFFPIILKWSKQVLIGTAVLYPLHFVFNPMPEINYWWFYFTEYLFYFTAGVALFHYLKGKAPARLSLRPFLKQGFLWVMLGFSFLVAIAGLADRLKDLSFLAAALFGLTWITLIWLYGLKENAVTRCLLFLGTISYSLYLIHVPLLLLLYSLCYRYLGWTVYTSPWAYLAPLPIVLPASYLFYRVFEVASFNLIKAQKRRLHKPSGEPNFAPTGKA